MTSQTFSIVQINNGGKEHNPFEYYFSNGSKMNTNEWDYKKTLSGFTKQELLGYLENQKNTKYMGFMNYVKTVEDDIFKHFFESNDELILTLDNKFGRFDSDIKRFNPVEFGYDKLYFTKSIFNQYSYVKEYAEKKGQKEVLIMKCLEVPFLNSKFSLENTEWLSKRYDIERVYDIIMYDMMKTLSVYHHYEEYDKIYIQNTFDGRMSRIIEKLGESPAIIISQEGGFEDSRLEEVYSVLTEGGVYLYSYNMNITITQINTIQEVVTDAIGTKKGFDIELCYKNKLFRLCGLHCKEPKGDRTYYRFVNEGIMGLMNSNGIISNIWNTLYNTIYYKLYGVYHHTTIIMGDMNPKNLEKSSYIKKQIEKQTYFKVYPENNEVTSNKIRSGYCAQKNKFWKSSESCKDMVLVENGSSLVNNYEVFPEIETLLTDKWCGDHSSLIVQITI